MAKIAAIGALLFCAVTAVLRACGAETPSTEKARSVSNVSVSSP